MGQEDLELSIVMPCLNEAETLGRCVEKAAKFLERSGIRGEVVIADNGSDDGSQDIAVRHGARVVLVAERGYGSALRGGIAAARGKFVIMGDADDSYDFSALMPFVEKLREGYDLCMGNRFLGGIQAGAMPPLHRYLGNPVLTAVGRLFFRSDCGDFHCGLRGFNRESILALGLRTTGMEFASEMVVKSTLLGLRIAEVPTTLSPDGRSGAPHLRSWRDGWRHLRFLLLFSPRWLFLYPGAALVGVGLVLSALILRGEVSLGGVALDVNTLVYTSAALLIGFQAILFAVFTKIFGISVGLLPEDQRLNRLFRYLTLETGLAAGGTLIVCGLVATFFALGDWGEQAFGPLDARQSLRLVIPAALSLALGFQIVLSSFFLSVLGLDRVDR
ncbi:MAG: glycosyltransferase family 2 protein [Myxococcota bacterium]|nr:glycosyltransferase family 2 protein [Myxococcota bacterium]